MCELNQTAVMLLLQLCLIIPCISGNTDASHMRGLLSRSMDAICPSYCECLKEETNERTTAYSAECHVATNTLPIFCVRRWVSLKLNLHNYTAPPHVAPFRTKPVFSYCHDLVSLYIHQTGENPIGFTLRSLLQGLLSIRRIWLHHVHVDTDGVEASNFYKVPPKLELIAFSDCTIKLDPDKPLFFDTPISLQQLRLSNISLTGSLSSRLMVNLCHTLTNAFRPNDLVSLYLDRNYLQNLDRNSLAGCQNLRVLQLSYNQLKGSLEEVLGLSSRILRQNWTFKKTLEAATTLEYGVLGHTPHLEALDLSGNFITGIRSPLWAYGRDGDTIRCLTDLKTISLSNNNLTYIVRGAFQGAPNLREIDLSRNPRLFCPMHLETPAFYSYIDPYIFGGVQKLTKVYWDFADKTCILSTMMSKSEYGVLSDGLFKLFAPRSLCLTEVTRKPQVENGQLALSGSAPAVTKTETEHLVTVGHTTEGVYASSLWTPIDIVSSFLCSLMGLLLVVLCVVLAFRSKMVFEELTHCCFKGISGSNLARTDDNSLMESRACNTINSFTLPSTSRHTGLVLLREDEIDRLNNGLRSNSLQNLCLSCMDQQSKPNSTTGPTQHPTFYDNYMHLTTSFLGDGKMPCHQKVKRSVGSEIPHVMVEMPERIAVDKPNVNDWSFI